MSNINLECFPFFSLPSCIHQRFIELQHLKTLHRLSQTCSWFYLRNLEFGKRAIDYLYVYTPDEDASDSKEQEPHPFHQNCIGYEPVNGAILRICPKEKNFTWALFRRLVIYRKLKMVYPDAQMIKFILEQVDYQQITDISITGIIHIDHLFYLKTPYLQRAHLSLMVIPKVSLAQILELADGIPRISFWFDECELPPDAEKIVADFKKTQGERLEKFSLKIGKPMDEWFE